MFPGRMFKAFTSEGGIAWELYNIVEDPAELHDLSGDYPEKAEEMVKMWEQYRDDNALLDISLDLSRGCE